jgi:hypothetical protein
MKKVLVQFNFPGMPASKYDQVWRDLRAAGHANPKGLIYHWGAQNGNDWVVVDLWESAEAFAAFGEVIMPLMAKNEVPEVEPTVLPVYFEYAAVAAAR